MRGEIFCTEQTFFFGGNEEKEDGALCFLGMCLQVCSHIQNCRAAGAIVHGPIINFVAVDGRADAHVIDVRGEDHVFIFESGVGTGKLGDNVGGFDGTGFDGRFGAERNR